MSPSCHRLIIALVGPCGVGKSTLASAISNLHGVDVIHERPPKVLETTRDYCDLDMPAIQNELLRMRLEQALAARSNIVVFDRTFDEDCRVFLRLHNELGGLSDQEHLRLEKAVRRIGKRIGIPDATVVMHAESGVLRQRIGKGARPAWLKESYDRQLELYTTFIADIKGAVLEVDTTFLTPHALRSLSAWIVETAQFAVKRLRMCESKEFGLRWDWREP